MIHNIRFFMLKIQREYALVEITYRSFLVILAGEVKVKITSLPIYPTFMLLLLCMLTWKLFHV